MYLCEFDGYCLSCSLALNMSCAASFLLSSLFAFAKNIWTTINVRQCYNKITVKKQVLCQNFIRF